MSTKENEELDLENQQNTNVITHEEDKNKALKKKRWLDLYYTNEDRNKQRELRKKDNDQQKEEKEMKQCTFVPKTIKLKELKNVVIYEKPEKHYKYETESQIDKNSLCETLFSGRIRTTNVILPDYGQPTCLNQKHCQQYIKTQSQLRNKKEELISKENNKPGSGNVFDKKISRVTVPVRTLLFSENAFSLREIKNSIRSVKKPIAPHKFLIGYEAKTHRKNPFRISKNLNLSSDQADKNIMNLNAQNHNNLIKINDGLTYDEAVSTLKKELKDINF